MGRRQHLAPVVVSCGLRASHGTTLQSYDKENGRQNRASIFFQQCLQQAVGQQFAWVCPSETPLCRVLARGAARWQRSPAVEAGRDGREAGICLHRYVIPGPSHVPDGPWRGVNAVADRRPRRGRSISNRGWSEAEPAVRTHLTKIASKRRLCHRPTPGVATSSRPTSSLITPPRVPLRSTRGY